MDLAAVSPLKKRAAALALGGAALGYLPSSPAAAWAKALRAGLLNKAVGGALTARRAAERAAAYDDPPNVGGGPSRRRLILRRGTPSNAAANRRASSGPESRADARMDAREEDARAGPRSKGGITATGSSSSSTPNNRATFWGAGATALRSDPRSAANCAAARGVPSTLASACAISANDATSTAHHVSSSAVFDERGHALKTACSSSRDKANALARLAHSGRSRRSSLLASAQASARSRRRATARCKSSSERIDRASGAGSDRKR